MFTTEKTINALIKRFTEAKWKTIQVTIKATGDTIHITPCSDNVRHISSVEDCSFFMTETECMMLWGASDIKELAETLNNFAEIKANNAKEKIECQQFYDKHIAPYSGDELRFANSVAYEIDRRWGKTDHNFDHYDDFIKKCAGIIGIMYHISKKRVMELNELSQNAGIYSDWYKSLYGIRPHFG